MDRMTRRRIALLAIPVLLVCGLVALIASGLLVVGVGPLRVNASGPTVTSGPVSIATDHSRYLATDRIEVIITNHLAVPIYTWDGYAYCSILALQVKNGGAWTPSHAAGCGCDFAPPCAMHCMLVGAHRLVTLAPGASYTASILHNPDTPFPAGVYRLALFYATEPPPQGTDGPSASAGTITTAPFDVLAVPLAPSACP